jgi:sugar phosphate isomerase/epimerase
MKISFMTLGCPTWDLDTICAKGREYGYDGVDLRGLLETLDITTLPAFTSGIAETKSKFADAGLEVSGIASSIKLCEPEKRQQNLEEARRTLGVAHDLSCQNIRVFGGGDLKISSRAKLAEIARESMAQILELDDARKVYWLFETHDNWISARDGKLLLDSIPGPAFGALWDMGHTARVGGETPDESYAAIGHRIGYTHIKDAVYDPTHPFAMSDGWRYVLPGTGQLPLAQAIKILKRHGYDGWLLFEHEKRWHPELAKPEIAFPAFVKWVKTLIS